MKKNILALSLVISALFSQGSAAIGLSFNAPDSSTIGDTFSVDLNVSGLGENNAPSLGGYDFDIDFNSTALSIAASDITFGDQLSSGSSGSISDVEVVQGQINLSEVSLESADLLNSSQEDEFTLANFQFTAENEGESTLDLDVNAFSDADGNALEVEVDPSSPTIVINPVPKPPNIASGLTPLQYSAGKATQQTCLGFQANNDANTAAEKDLFRISCAVTDNFDDNNENLNLEGIQLNSAAQNIAAEETLAPATLAIKNVSGQSTNIVNRLTGIHSGVMGFSVGRANQRLSAYDDAFLTGGGAGDENFALSERLGGFLNLTGGYGESDQTEWEDEYKFDTLGMTLGLDYRFTDQLVAGVAFGYDYHDIDFEESALVAGGAVTSDNYSGSLYSTFTQGDYYVDGILTYGSSRYDINRSIFIDSNTSAQGADRKASANPDGNQIAAALGAGYEFNYGALNVTPYVRASYLHINIDSYEESNAGGLNLQVEEQDAESFQTVLGGQISYVFNQSYGVIIPQIGIDWHHEFIDNVRKVNASYVNDPRHNILTMSSGDPDRDFANLNVSVSGVFSHGVQAFVAFDTLLGASDFDSNMFTAGVRVSF